MKTYPYITGFTALCLLAGGAFAAAPVEGLLAHWTFDDSGSNVAVDVTGNGHDATLLGGITLAEEGMKYGSLKTSGIGQGAIFYSTDSEQITVACWVQRLDTESPSNPRVIETNGYRLFVSYDEYKIDLVFQQDFKLPDNTQATGKWRVILPYSYNEDWVHVAVSYDRTNNLNEPKFYVDGELYPVVIDQIPPPATGHPIKYMFRAAIGNRPQCNALSEGYFDELRLYNRVLDDAEVAAIYEAEFPFFFFPGLVDIGGGWQELPWYGNINIADFPWVDHEQHGWTYFGYVTKKKDNPIYTAYDSELNWIVFSRNIYPRIYSYNLDKDLVYQEGSKAPRWFKDLKTNTMVSVP